MEAQVHLHKQTPARTFWEASDSKYYFILIINLAGEAPTLIECTNPIRVQATLEFGQKCLAASGLGCCTLRPV